MLCQVFLLIRGAFRIMGIVCAGSEQSAEDLYQHLVRSRSGSL